MKFCHKDIENLGVKHFSSSRKTKKALLFFALSKICTTFAVDFRESIKRFTKIGFGK